MQSAHFPKNFDEIHEFLPSENNCWFSKVFNDAHNVGGGGRGERGEKCNDTDEVLVFYVWVPLSPSESRVIIFLSGRDKKEGRVAAVSNDI